MPKSSYVITPASTYPVSASELKAFLRVTGSDDDTMIANMIAAATDAVEQFIGRKLIATTMGLWLDGFGQFDDEAFLALGEGIHDGSEQQFMRGCSEIYLPINPVASVTSIKTYDKANTESTLSSSAYSLDTNGRIYLNSGYSWPTDLRDKNAVLVTYVAAYSSVPASIKQAVTALAAQMYECRGACDMPDTCKAMLAQYRVIDQNWI